MFAEVTNVSPGVEDENLEEQLARARDGEGMFSYTLDLAVPTQLSFGHIQLPCP